MKNIKKDIVMTPEPIVNLMLDKAGLNGEQIIFKKIMEPSFGDGNFLCAIILKILDICAQYHMQKAAVKKIIEKNIYGFEIDKGLYSKAISKLNKLTHGLDIDWKNLICGNTLAYDKQQKFDCVIGNPPYIKNADIDESTKTCMQNMRFTNGITDMYMAFMEIGLDMLKPNGILAMITPNSYMKNASQQKFRDFLISNKSIKAVYDFKSSKVFKEGTYSCISILSKNKQESIELAEYTYNKTGAKPNYKLQIDAQEFQSLFEGKPWCITHDIQYIKNMSHKQTALDDIAYVQNGVATNAIKIYLIKPFFDKELTKPCTGKIQPDTTVYFKYEQKIESIESGLIRRAVKGSRYNGEEIDTYLIYPYDEHFNSYDEKTMQKNFPLGYQYLLKNKKLLENRDMEPHCKNWYEYGRSQAVKSINREKIVFKQIYKKDIKNITSFILDEDVVVFGGIFITKKENEDLKKIQSIIESKDFAKYCTIIGKDMANGYVSINTKQIKQYRF